MSSETVVTSSTTSVTKSDSGIEQSEATNDPGEDLISSCDDYDEEDKLVIDLDKYNNDVDKANKEVTFGQTSSGRNTPARNNNNNNCISACGAATKHSTAVQEKTKTSSLNSSSKFTSSRAHSPTSSSAKNGRSKSKKSSKSSSTKQNSPPPGSSSSETGSSGSSKPSHSASSDSKPVSSVTTSSPDDVNGKKNKSSKPGRSQHKKHKHDKIGPSNGARNDAEKARSKSKQAASLSTGGAGFPSTTQYMASHVTPTSSVTSSAMAPSKVPTSRRCDSPSTALGTQSSGSKQSQGAAPQNRQTNRGGVMLGGVTSASKQSGSERDPCAGSDAQGSQGGRKKVRKTPSNSISVSPANSDSDTARSYSAMTSSTAKRASGAQHGQDGSGSKKMKLDGEIKRSANNAPTHKDVFRAGDAQHSDNKKSIVSSSSHSRISPECGETRFLKSSSSSQSSTPTSTPPVFAPSSIFTSLVARPNPPSGSLVSNSTQTTSVWSNSTQESITTLPSQRSVGTVTSIHDVGVMTEPDALGPCEPGTSVHLDGIVWHETDTGVLVVNVTWRNRTYVGTLLDATKHDWAPPRLAESEIDMELRAKNGRTKRPRNGASDASVRKGRSRGAIADDFKGSPSAAAKKRAIKTSESELADGDVTFTPKTGSKRSRRNMTPQLQQAQNDRNGSNGAGSESSGCSSPVSFNCRHPNCNKKYKNANGLKYHQDHAHLDYDATEVKDDVMDGDTNEEAEERISDAETLGKPHDSAGDIGQRVSMEASNLATTAAAGKSRTGDVTEATSPSRGNVVAGQFTPASNAPTNPVTSRYLGNHGNESMSTNGEPPMDTQRAKPDVAETFPPAERMGSNPDNATSESENDVAVRNLLLQFRGPDEQALPASYSQDSPAPTVSLVSRAEPTSANPVPHPGYKYDDRPPINEPNYTRPTGPAQASVTSQMEKMPETMTSRFVDDNTAVVSSASYNNVTMMSEQDPKNIMYSSASQSVSVYGVSPIVQSTGVKTVKGKTVPVPVDPTHSLLASPSGSVTSPNNLNNATKKAKRKKVKDGRMPGEGAEPVGLASQFIKQEHVTMIPTNDNLPGSIPSSVGAAAMLNNMAASIQNAQKTQQGVMKPGSDISASMSLAQGPHIKTEPGINYPPKHIYPPHATPRRVQGVVTPATSAPNHNVTVKGTYHPLPDPHKPQTAVSAQAQDRLRASRNASPTNSSNRNNNNKLGGVRTQPDHGGPKPRLATSAPPQEVPDVPRDYPNRPKYPDYKVRPGEVPSGESCAQDTLSKMQDRCENTIINTYATQRSQAPRSKAATPQLEVTKQSEPVRSTSPIEVPADDNRPRHHVISPMPTSRPKEVASEVREASPKQPEVSYPANPQAAAFLHPPHFIGYPAITPFGLFPHAADSVAAYQLLDPRMRQQWMQEYEKQQQLIQQHQQQQHQQQQQQHQQQQAEKRARKAAEEKVPVKSEAGKPPQPPTEMMPDWTLTWVQQSQGKRPSTASPSPLPVQNNKDRIPHPQVPPHQTRYKSPQPSHTSLATSSNPTRSHSVAPSIPSASGVSQPYHHARSESLDRVRRSEVKEEPKGNSLSRKSSPSLPRERSPEKAKEAHPAVFPPDNPSALQYFASPYSYPPPRMPYPMPAGYVFPPGVFPQSAWPGPGQPPSASGKQSPPLKPNKDLPPGPSRSPRDQSRAVVETKERDSSTIYSMAKDRRTREAPVPRKEVRSPDPKHSVASPRAPSSHPSDHKTSSPPTQRHLHTHHHIHEGVPPYNQFIGAPQPYYPGAIHPQAVIPPDAVVANYQPGKGNSWPCRPGKI